MASQTPKQVFIFDMMRHRSHLFFRFLGTHPDIEDLWHPFLGAFLHGPERMTLRTKNENGTGHESSELPPETGDTYADSIDKFLQAVKSTENKGKVLVANEHCQVVFKQDVTLAALRDGVLDMPASFNPTVIPDRIFNTLTPIFVIRNPVFSVPSNYTTLAPVSSLRPGGEDWRMVNGIFLQQRLFELIYARDGKPPLVVDGDDVVWRTDEVRSNLAQALDLDPKGMSEAWEATPEDQRHPDTLVRHFLQTIDDSTGIERLSDHRPDPDLQKAYGKWVDKFGQAVADQLRVTAEENMPHYEYMAQFKI